MTSTMPIWRGGHSVLIVGGGPTGLATAIELAELGLSIAVIERSDDDDVRVGEHLYPSAVPKPQATLALDTHVASAGIEAYWGSETPNYMDYLYHPGQRGLNLPRPQFDADLTRACEQRGVTVLRNASLKRALKRKAGWEIEISIDSNVRKGFVLIVIDATGRAATFARSQGTKVCAHDRQVAVVAFGDDSNSEPNSRSLVETADLGWWYSAPIGPARRICMLVTDDDFLPKGLHSQIYEWWLNQLNRTTQLARRFGDAALSQQLVVRSARSQRSDRPCGIDWFAVGNAAMAVDPLASRGIAKALEIGKRTALDISAYIRGDATVLDRFALDLEREYAAYRATRAAYYRIEKRWPQSMFWRRRHEEAATA